MLVKVQEGNAQPFKVTAPLVSRGVVHSDTILTERLSVLLKVYAEGGENTHHAHPNEDHAFVVLDGQATFRLPRDPKGDPDDVEEVVLGVNDGIMLPRNTYYSFENSGDGNLAMLRVGASTNDRDVWARVNTEGRDFDGADPANGFVEPVLTGEMWGQQPSAQAAASNA